ncbi:Glutamyl-tRNA(Gln) amidotransferase subunit A, mitochondrial [Smittium mucronatum]|uniref:Glutamyl-tRNA(Gln) amidotransferase subunit A, mitochondrial n=1 Tax=Smittium mucronatum TaxID=133383 RepID=A0A1R0H0R7_9FUNG|nr:Glutamyl-tRNA(Gln) amidotransferase subunit A, mitochondrial [Smittium mucronatum]
MLSNGGFSFLKVSPLRYNSPLLTKFSRQYSNVSQFGVDLYRPSSKPSSLDLKDYLDQLYIFISSQNKKLNPIVHLRNKDSVLSSAKNLSTSSSSNTANLTPPIVLSIKDNIAVKDVPLTCASQALNGYSSPYNATVVDLLESSGNLVIGKTNMDEFGMGSTNTNTIFGPVINPYTDSQDISSGGSSGGSAVSVASRMCNVSLGSDTGGSIRLPASWCGIYGFKPSFGTVSRHGLVAYANSSDTIGIVSESVLSAKTVYDIISKHDPSDMTCLPDHFRSIINNSVSKRNALLFKQNLNLKGLTVGIPKEYYISELSGSILSAWKSVSELLLELGAEIKPVSLPNTKYALSAYYTITAAEASSNMARYDGIRYGPSVPQSSDLDHISTIASDKYSKYRNFGLGPEVKKRVITGNYVLSSSVQKNYYIKAQQIRRLIQRDFDSTFRLNNILTSHHLSNKTQTNGIGSPISNNQNKFESGFLENTPVHKEIGVDLLLMPTTANTAPFISEVSSTSKSANKASPNSVKVYVNDVMTVPINLAGIPAASIPVGICSNNHLPIGLQIVGQYGDDQLVLSVSQALEKALSQKSSQSNSSTDRNNLVPKIEY